MSTALTMQHRCAQCGEWWVQAHCCPKQTPLQIPAGTAQARLDELARLRAALDALEGGK